MHVIYEGGKRKFTCTSSKGKKVSEFLVETVRNNTLPTTVSISMLPFYNDSQIEYSLNEDVLQTPYK